jgi:hypothetical protein
MLIDALLRLFPLASFCTYIQRLRARQPNQSILPAKFTQSKSGKRLGVL